MNLLEEIIQDIIKDAPLATTLRKAFILSSKLDSAEFKEWVAYELDGYPTAGKEFGDIVKLLPPIALNLSAYT